MPLNSIVKLALLLAFTHAPSCAQVARKAKNLPSFSIEKSLL
jgi:hypothetical protein